MGTWDTGPFGNDTAADFSITLDEARLEERESIVRGVLMRTIAADGWLIEAEQAVAAAALIAAQCPGGQPVDPIHGPHEPMPTFAVELRALAVEALERIANDETGLVANWVTEADARTWLAGLRDVSNVLVPPPPSMDVPLFDLPM
ncbi:DUF4259 domain-containing protein [Yinghuangia seranimata]|uniref:DUF4259 domain-containing protein n=1 Tax=Yinghuangia seranimata TaxID=408067 RepID=UPI00248BE656|nr:DUF4259 domain-containing protein [Yinghuangia seranimata]MDI2128367.1 DUF4259 domain-containing protein [Yinghuangia seranimata]